MEEEWYIDEGTTGSYALYLGISYIYGTPHYAYLWKKNTTGSPYTDDDNNPPV